ncbi:hypothetical protein FPZ43_13810 [Mucilaginibacter pallidiroseus]|uniref:Uncharacterized protein n=1 Tax=Mucilaginibacter pallidiroseus TaxID=2599295 RepID=A0A563U899_9SPHI|nr:hypothetical protein [Mucilaginibacter pallidiroseus]TWR27544.1 hypothetical protein FPZ43_13810 [Mucilaginibacter pallidiroseus]
MATDKDHELSIDPEDLDNSTETNDNLDNDNLNYNEELDSYELDVKGEDEDYDHPDPYDTSAKNGEDFDSTYDEANPYDVKGEFDTGRSLETDAESLGMHIDSGKIVELDPRDEALAHTPEDDRDDLDEEGYPINDKPNDVA